MNMLRRSAAAFYLALIPVSVVGQDQHTDDIRAPYAGWQERAIKSLSPEDLKEIRDGAGWGLALPAELNGWPGPKHLLEMRQEMGLTPDQTAAITQSYDDMRAAAIDAGARFIAAEAELSGAFANTVLTEDELRHLVD